jgi:LacI family transcriptional regulator
MCGYVIALSVVNELHRNGEDSVKDKSFTRKFVPVAQSLQVAKKGMEDNMKKVTMQDIADQLGLTKVSVSKALNSQPGISEKTRKKIIETAAEMGYQSKVIVDNANNHKCFAMIVPKRFFLETDGFYTEIFYYLNKLCLNTGNQIYSIVLSFNEEENLILPEPLQSMKFDGIFLMGELKQQYIHMLAAKKWNTVVIDFYRKELETDFILTDNFFLGYRAAQYLLERGHKDIGFVGNIFQTNSIMDRYFGYLKAMMCAGIKVSEEWHLVNNDENGLYMNEIKIPERMPTAFVCHCDMAAYYMIDTLSKAGLSVPKDVSLISFDNTKLSENTSPRLTTFDINRKNIAVTAYRCMIDKCEKPYRGMRRFLVNNDLVERESVQCINEK